MKYHINSAYLTIGAAIALVFGVIMATPAQAHAFSFGQIIDPGCFFACDSGGGHTTRTVTNNYNGNYKSPGGTVVNGNVTTAAPSSPTYQTTYYPPTYYPTTPVYAYNTYYPPTYQQNQGPLQVSCYPMPLSATVGQSVTWYASAYGGNGSYYYSWTGDESLSGYGQSIAKQYYYAGYKNGSITVTSGGQSVSQNCSGSVNVTGGYYNNPPTYYPPTQYYNNLQISCSANTTYGTSGSSVTWTAYASGGNGGYYTYSWTGTDGLYGNGQSIYYTYSNPGYKTASVTVYSNGQQITQNCTNSVNISYGTYYQPGYPSYPTNSNYDGLDIGCYSDPSTARIDQPVTWTAEVTRGAAPYTYSWSGSGSLSGSAATVIKYYSTTGEKNAIVTVTSADGKTGTRACSNTVTVRGNGGGTTVQPPVQQPPQQPPANTNPLSAASIFSLSNIPWGWVAVLVILVLFATVMYLLFNKPKI